MTRSENQMFALDFLGVSLSDRMLLIVKMSLISAPAIGIPVADAEGFKKLFEFEKSFIFVRSQDISEDLTAVMIDGMLVPSLILYFRHKTPHFIQFGFLDFSDRDQSVFRNKALQERFVDCEQRAFFFLFRQSLALG